MPLITEWDNDQKTILRVTYQPGWTWDEMEDNLPLEREFLDGVDHPVDVIADFRGTSLPPGAIARLPKIASSPPYTHPNSGIVIMVGSPAFMEEVVGIYRRVFGQAGAKLTMVHDLDEARAKINEMRQTIRESAEESTKSADLSADQNHN